MFGKVRSSQRVLSDLRANIFIVFPSIVTGFLHMNLWEIKWAPAFPSRPDRMIAKSRRQLSMSFSSFFDFVRMGTSRLLWATWEKRLSPRGKKTENRVLQCFSLTCLQKIGHRSAS